MNFIKNIPIFSYITSSPQHHHNNCILADGEVIHRIEDLNKFYAALGYTDKLQKDGVDPEFFRWYEFTKDHAVESAACLQNKIIEYLKKHSAIFNEKYGTAYESWAESCAAENLRDTVDCKICRMHPREQLCPNS